MKGTHSAEPLRKGFIMKKRIISFLLLFLMLIGLCSCGEAEPSEPKTDGEPVTNDGLVEGWIAETIPLPEGVDEWYGMEKISLYEGVIYLSASTDHIPVILCYDTENGSWSRIEYDSSDLWELAELTSVSVAEGTLWALLCNQGWDHPREYSILRCDLNRGLTADRISIPFEAEPDYVGGVPIFSDLYALSTNRALLSDARYAYCVDSSGQKLQTIETNGRRLTSYCRVNGELFFEGENGSRQRFDSSGFCFAEEIPVEAVEVSFFYESENGHLFFNGADRELLCYDADGGESSAIFNWMDVAVDTGSLNAHHLFETASGDCYYPAKNCLVKVTRTMLKPKTELKMLCFMEDEEYIPDSMQGAGQYMDAILYFNSTDPDYKIRVTTISGSKEDMTRNLIQIATSADYDLIDTGILPDGALDSSLLTDLIPYLDADPEISREDFIPNALAGMLRNGKLYAVTPYVQIMTWGMRADQYPGKESWDIETVTRMIANRNNEQVFFWTRSRNLLVKMLSKIATSEFIDFDNAVCRFDDGRFAQWLELLGSIPYSTDFSDERCLYEPVFEMNTGTVWNIKRLIQSEDYLFCGFPGASGNGHYFARVGQNLGRSVSDPSSNVSMGIMAASHHKEAAWAFLRILLQRNMGSGIPVLASRLDEQLATLVTDETIRGYQSFTEKDAEKMRELVYATDKTVREDQQLLELISGVINDYLGGRYSAEDAAKNLQSRASIYVAEHG